MRTLKFQKRYITAGLLCAALLLTLTCGVNAQAAEGAFTTPEQTMVMVKLEKPVTMEETTDSEAVVATINKRAMEVGLNNLRLHGTNSFEKSEDGATRVAIEWHSISLKTDTDAVIEPLPKLLSSQFRTFDPKTEAGTRLTARGDWEEVLKSLGELQKKKANEVVKVENTEEESEDSDGDGLETVGSSGTSSTVPTTSDSYDSVNTDKMSTTYETCPDFVDEAQMRVFEQKRKYTVGESGTVYEDGLCQNTGVFWDVEETPGECSYQYNFEEGVAYKMVQWTYTKENDTIEIGDCRASNSTYPISEYNDVCEVYIDNANGVAFPQSRFGILVGETRFYATECQPMGSVEWPLYEEYCFEDDGVTKIYNHDFVNHISYPLVRKYYVMNEGEADEEKVYASECGVSGTESYSHKFESAACGWEMDDETMVGVQFSTTYISTTEGDVEIAPCEARGPSVPYGLLGEEYMADDPGVLLVRTASEENPSTYTPPANAIAVDFNSDPTPRLFVVPGSVSRMKIRVVGAGSDGRTGAAAGSGYHCGTPPLYIAYYAGAGSLASDDNVNVVPGEKIAFYVGTNALDAAEGSFFGNDGVDASFTKMTAAGGVVNGPRGGGYSLAGWDDPTSEAGHRCVQTTGSHTVVGAQGGLTGWGANGSSDGFHTCGSSWPDGQGGGRGTPGAIQLIFPHRKYLRPDGTYYWLPIADPTVETQGE